MHMQIHKPVLWNPDPQLIRLDPDLLSNKISLFTHLSKLTYFFYNKFIFIASKTY